MMTDPTDQTQLPAGTNVESADGQKLGSIKEIQLNHYLVEKGLIFKHDLYVHKDAEDGKVVFAGGNSSQPGTSEQVVIDPATSGAGDYFVHIVYADVVPADQYHGTASLKSATGPGASPPPREHRHRPKWH